MSKEPKEPYYGNGIFGRLKEPTHVHPIFEEEPPSSSDDGLRLMGVILAIASALLMVSACGLLWFVGSRFGWWP